MKALPSLPACLPTYLPCLPACLPAYLGTLPAYLPTYLLPTLSLPHLLPLSIYLPYLPPTYLPYLG